MARFAFDPVRFKAVMDDLNPSFISSLRPVLLWPARKERETYEKEDKKTLDLHPLRSSLALVQIQFNLIISLRQAGNLSILFKGW
jgi:hypothetical protein